jgi:hypothetical protein
MPPAGELGLVVGRTRFAACCQAPRTGGRRQRCNNRRFVGNVRCRMGSGVRHVPGELFFRRPPPRDERAPRAAAVPVGKRCNSVECRCRLQLRRTKPGTASIRASSVPPSPNSVCHAKDRGGLSPYASHGYVVVPFGDTWCLLAIPGAFWRYAVLRPGAEIPLRLLLRSTRSSGLRSIVTGPPAPPSTVPCMRQYPA